MPLRPRLVEQRRGLVRGHLALEEGVDLVLVLHPPAQEEGGERQLGKDDEVAAVLARLAQEVEHAGNDRGAAVGALDRPELRGADGDDAAHATSAIRAERVTSSALRPTIRAYTSGSVAPSVP